MENNNKERYVLAPTFIHCGDTHCNYCPNTFWTSEMDTCVSHCMCKLFPDDKNIGWIHCTELKLESSKILRCKKCLEAEIKK